MNQKIKFLSLIIISSLLISGCTSKKQQNTNMDLNTLPTPNITITPTDSSVLGTETQSDTIISLKTKDGEILLKLYQDKAPNTVANFINKADTDFYNGLTFHRVIPGFMAQSGDPLSNGKQNSELNNIPFVRGSLGLAPTSETMFVSSDNQFFICFDTSGCQHLTSEYVNFGEVISGLDVLDKITQGDQIISITSKTK